MLLCLICRHSIPRPLDTSYCGPRTFDLCDFPCTDQLTWTNFFGPYIWRSPSDQPQYKASISVPDSRGPERILTIRADVDVVCDIMLDIIPTVSKQLNRSDEEDHEIRILIHQSHAGRVIGRGGTRIKELREETGSQIKIYVDCAPMSSERVVQITGGAQQITSCIAAMFETMDGVPKKGDILLYNPNNFDEYAVQNYGGYCDDRGGRHRGGGPRESRMSGGRDDRRGFGGNSSRRFSEMGPRDGGGMGRMGSGFGDELGGFMSGRGAMEKMTMSQVSIPKNLAGAILGRGGSRIKQVQHESGTKIKLDDGSPDSNVRIISITGTQEQIQFAQYLLQMAVKRHAE